MIWTEQEIETAWAEFLAAEIQKAGLGRGDLAGEAARGMAFYCLEQFRTGPAPADYVRCMVRHVARQLDGSPKTRKDQGVFLPWPLWKRCASGLYRRSEWPPREEAWVLDLARVEGWPTVPLELLWFPAVARLIADMGPLWDGVRGAGSLGLAGWAPAGLRPSARQAWRTALLRVAEAALERLARQRNWPSPPSVYFL